MNNLTTLFDLIGELARRRFQIAEKHYSALRLNHTEARLLTLLHREDGKANQDTLSNMLNVDRSNAGRALKSLEDEGYIERFQNTADKRTNLVNITDEGRQIVVQIEKVKEKMIQEFLGDLTEDEAGQIINLLRKVYSNEADI